LTGRRFLLPGGFSFSCRSGRATKVLAQFLYNLFADRTGVGQFIGDPNGGQEVEYRLRLDLEFSG
jgi:hypothetical protein